LYEIHTATDPVECEFLWRRTMPDEFITDLWEFRECFNRHFQRPLRFLFAEKAGQQQGLLPLCWIEEAGCLGFFPGETWKGRTWVEQNRVISNNPGALGVLLDSCQSPYHLRYMLPLDSIPQAGCVVDEIGYLFLPPDYDYDMENYFGEFSNKSAKRIKRELAAIEGQGVRYRFNELSDFDYMVRLSVERFGELSYFSDHRFREGFRDVARFLAERGWLQMTTILINDEVAAVDLGSLYRGTYTLLAGGTHGGYPGVAKLINIHHIRRACEERFERVDFLCGDFSWKILFHLTPRPLYLLSNTPVESPLYEEAAVGSTA